MTKRTEKPTRDLYQEVTDSIVTALETCGDWTRPWINVSAGAAYPRNVDGRAYRGVNTVLLWVAAMDAGYTSGVWGTYKAWQAKGAQVRKGERSTLVTLWRPFDRKATADEIADGKADAEGRIRSLLLRHYNVFAHEQVDGYDLPEDAPLDPTARDAAADEFFAAIGADVVYGGNRAAYSSTDDVISMPDVDQFDTTARYVTTLAHEHGHWTGHASRLDRKLGNRFGSEAYAAEELIAELTSAFVAAALGYHPTVRDDHAAYVKNWIKVLRDDKRAIITAASQAQKAADFLTAAAGRTADTETTTEEVAA